MFLVAGLAFCDALLDKIFLQAVAGFPVISVILNLKACVLCYTQEVMDVSGILSSNLVQGSLVNERFVIEMRDSFEVINGCKAA